MTNNYDEALTRLYEIELAAKHGDDLTTDQKVSVALAHAMLSISQEMSTYLDHIGAYSASFPSVSDD